MSDFIDAILSPVNLVFTVLLGVMFIYWLLVCLGGVDMDSFDIDIDTDLDGTHHGIPAAGFLRFFNLGEVPLMVLASVFILVMWVVGVWTYAFIGHWSVLGQALLLIPTVIGAALLTKLVTAPLKKIFRSLEDSQHTGEIEFIGMRCIVTSLSLDARHGQVEVQTDGAPIKLNACLDEGDPALSRNAEAVIVSHDPDRGVYRVRGF